MVAAFTPTTSTAVALYGVVVQPAGWIHRLFLAEELRPLGMQLHLGSEAEVLVGDFEGRVGTIKRVLQSTDFQNINGYRRDGWQVPLDKFAISSPESDKLARFQECDRAIENFIGSWQAAATAALEIERDELWAAAGYPSVRAYWMAKGEAAAAKGVKSLTYERMLQLKGAAEVTETLEAHGVPVEEIFTSEKTLRAVRAVPEDQQVAVAAAVVAEHEATGRPVTEALVKKVSAEVIAGHSMPDVQHRYAPYGVFKPFNPTSRKNRQYRYIFEGQGKTRLFTDLDDAVIWFDAHLSHQTPSDGMGCPTCANCTLAGGAGECGVGHGHVTHLRLWNMAAHCQAWAPQAEAAIAPAAPTVDDYQTVADYLAAAGFEPESEDMINPDQDPPIAYRGWQIVTDSEERGMLSFSIRDSANDQWYTLLCMEGRFQGATEDEAIAYSRAVIDRAMALGVKLSGQFSLLATPAPAVNPQQNIHQRMTASAAGRKEPSPHDENNTPSDLWAPALIARGLTSYTLDPMTNAASTVPAEVQWTKAEDCFAQKTWRVAKRVFMFANPAFSLNEEFSSRFAQELEAGNIDEALILDKADSRTAWGQRLLAKADLIIRVYGYTKFENADRENGSATFPIELLYYGDYAEEIAQAYQHLGLPTVPYKF